MRRKLTKIWKVLRWWPEIEPVATRHIGCLENREQSLWGSLTEQDEQRLIELTRQAADYSGPIVEIGALFGLTTQLITTVKPVQKPLIAVENFSWNPFYIPSADHRLMTQRVLRYATAYCNTSIYDGSKSEFYRAYDGERPALVFIDAGHRYQDVIEDVQWACDRQVPIISGHDYSEAHPGVIQAVNEIFGDGVEVRGSVWSVQR